MEHRRRRVKERAKGSSSLGFSSNSHSKAILPSDLKSSIAAAALQNVVRVMPLPEVVIPEITAARDELWHERVKELLLDAIKEGGPGGEVGCLECGIVRVSELENAIKCAEEGGRNFLTNSRMLEGVLEGCWMQHPPPLPSAAIYSQQLNICCVSAEVCGLETG